ncbi:hypothetical protein [Bradyrhizobium sp. F1.13.3]|uniref:hypothetical protein n=1 Tax=Bradyrhizobium sp. F1.13.3 TaxID=3156351 RepID=UPI00339ACD36
MSQFYVPQIFRANFPEIRGRPLRKLLSTTAFTRTRRSPAMSEQLDLLEEIDEQTTFSTNVGSHQKKRWRAGCLSVSPQFERAKVARAAPDDGTPEAPPAAASEPEAAPEPPSVPAAVPRIITTREELVDMLRRRRDELGLTHQTIDGIAGLQDGYTSKLLAPKPIKNLGPMSLEAMLGALALGIVRIEFVEDPELATRMRSRWTRRTRPKFRTKRTRGALLADCPQQTVTATTEDNNVETTPEFPTEG